MKKFLFGFNVKSYPSKYVYINVWRRPDGEFYVRVTKHRVSSSYCLRKYADIGYVNSYGHVLVDSIRQYIELED